MGGERGAPSADDGFGEPTEDLIARSSVSRGLDSIPLADRPSPEEVSSILERSRQNEIEGDDQDGSEG